MACLTGLHLACALLLAAPASFPAVQQSGSSSLNQDNLRASVAPPPQAIRPRVPITPELRGDIFMARKEYREAIDMYRTAGNSPIILNKIGIAFHQMLQLGLAKKYYKEAIKADPHYAEAINNLGTVFYAQKSYKKAIVYYRRSLRYWKPNASIYVNIGAAYFGRHDYKRASEYYEKALALDPDVFEHRSTFGTLMQEQSVDQLALFHLYLAKSYAKEGMDERALQYLRKALEEGVRDRNKIPDIPEFAQLKKEPGFQQLMAENPKPL